MSEHPSASASGSSPIPRKDNRRRSPRRSPRSSTRVVCRKGSLGLGPNIALALGNVSQVGIQLVVKDALQRGQEVEVCLLAPGFSREFKLSGRVVWCTPAANGTHCIGIEFDKQLPFSTVQDLGRQ